MKNTDRAIRDAYNSGRRDCECEIQWQAWLSAILALACAVLAWVK